MPIAAPYFGTTLSDLGSNIVARNAGDASVAATFQNYLAGLEKLRSDARQAEEQRQLQAQQMQNNLRLGLGQQNIEQQRADAAAKLTNAQVFQLMQSGQLTPAMQAQLMIDRQKADVQGRLADAQIAQMNQQGQLTPRDVALFKNNLEVAKAKAGEVSPQTQAALERGKQDRLTKGFKSLNDIAYSNALAKQSADIANAALESVRNSELAKTHLFGMVHDVSPSEFETKLIQNDPITLSQLGIPPSQPGDSPKMRYDPQQKMFVPLLQKPGSLLKAYNSTVPKSEQLTPDFFSLPSSSNDQTGFDPALFGGQADSGASPTNYPEGTTAWNPKTNERLILRNGKWQPIQ